jgi:primosomal replication protein N
MKKQQLTNTAKAAAVVTMGMTLVLGATGIAQAGTSSRGHDATDGHGSQKFQNPLSNRHSQGGQHTAHGVIGAVSTTSITVLGQGSAPTVLAITSATTVFEGATTATPAALAVGESVSVSLSNTAPNTAAKITIQVAKIQGKVTSVSANAITLSGPEGFSRTVDVGSTTTYSEGGTATTLSAVLVGSTISASGVVGSNQTTLNALSIVISAPKDVRGTLSAVSPTSITVAGPNEISTVLALTSATTVLAGSIATTASVLAVGQHVDVALARTSAATASRITITIAKLDGTVSAVTSSVITLAGHQGFVRVINVSSSTKFSEGGTATTSTAVVVGSKISVQGLVASDQTSLNALRVTIAALSDIRGVVTAVSATSLTVLSPNSTSTVFGIGSSTAVFEGTLGASASALALGQHVNVARLASAPTSATKVTIALVTVAGKVTAVSSSTITITGHQGFARVINVSSSTKYSEGGTAAALAAVVVGSKISAQGVVASDQTSLNALMISIVAPKAA